MRGFRPLSRIAHPSLINSYFLGGPSSLVMFSLSLSIAQTLTFHVNLRRNQ